MEHLHTLFVSILLAGIISYFLPANVQQEKKDQIVTFQSRPSISPEMILSWLDETESKFTHNNNEFFIKNLKQFLILDLPDKKKYSTAESEDKIVLVSPKYWEVVHSIESKQGQILYRPRNKEKSCVNTSAPCGHYQISVQALKDIGCKTDKCKIDREDSHKSLLMSKKLENINLERLARKGYNHLPDYQKYLIHQQGATGISQIFKAQEDRYELSKTLIKNMANNSSYSYENLKSMGSKLAAKKFLGYWEKKWDTEVELIFNKQLKQQMAIREYLQVASNIHFPN